MNQWLLGSGAGILIFLGIHIFLSDDIAVSFSEWMRYATGALVFWIFYSYTEKKHLKLFIHTLFVFVLYILLAWIMFPHLPNMWTQYLPSHHLLQSASGHHLASIPLIFAFAPSFLLWVKTRKLTYGILTLCFFVGSVCTLSRATVLIELGMACGIVLMHRRMWIPIVLTAIISAMTFWFAFSPPGEQFFQRFRNKQFNPTISRIQYWNQAFKAIADKPLLGHGLGTFFIQSTRFQSAPMTQSWFAHNSILELLAELGYAGTLLIIGFVLYLCIRIKKQLPTLKKDQLYGEALITGLLSLFFYSLINYPLHFFIIFLLFWASIGILAGISQKPQQSYYWEMFVVRVVCGIFVFGILITLVDTLLFRYHKIPCPFINYNAIQSCLIRKKYAIPPSALYLQWMERLHKHNPNVLYALGWYYEDIQNEQTAAVYYAKTFSYDPFDPYYTYRYLASVALSAQSDTLGQTMTFIGCHRYTKKMCQQIKQLRLSEASYEPAYKEIFTQAATRTIFQDYPLILYKLGLFFLPTDPDRTKALWQTSKDLWPTYAPFWAELASLEQHIFHNPDQARMILTDCLQYKDAQKECEMRLQEAIPLPGFLSDPITKWWEYILP